MFGLEFDVRRIDVHERLLAYVFIDGEMVNKLLLQEGMARVSTYPPNVRYVEEFIRLEQEARENERGFWGTYFPIN